MFHGGMEYSIIYARGYRANCPGIICESGAEKSTTRHTSSETESRERPRKRPRTIAGRTRQAAFFPICMPSSPLK